MVNFPPILIYFIVGTITLCFFCISALLSILQLSVVLNGLCVLHEKAPVSDRVTKCCSESLVNRRPCFSSLGVDDTYVPKEFNAETFTFHADVCTLPEQEQQVKKQT